MAADRTLSWWLRRAAAVVSLGCGGHSRQGGGESYGLEAGWGHEAATSLCECHHKAAATTTMARLLRRRRRLPAGATLTGSHW